MGDSVWAPSFGRQLLGAGYFWATTRLGASVWVPCTFGRRPVRAPSFGRQRLGAIAWANFLLVFLPIGANL